jgi:hypothetical protein
MEIRGAGAALHKASLHWADVRKTAISVHFWMENRDPALPSEEAQCLTLANLAKRERGVFDQVRYLLDYAVPVRAEPQSAERIESLKHSRLA